MSGTGCGSEAGGVEGALGVSTGGEGAWAEDKELDRIARVITIPSPIMPIGKTTRRANRACWLENPVDRALVLIRKCMIPGCLLPFSIKNGPGCWG